MSRLALQRVRPGETEMGEYEERIVREHAAVVNKFTELGCRFGALGGAASRPAHARTRDKARTPNSMSVTCAHLQRSCGLQKLDGLGGIIAIDFDGCPNSWEPIVDNDGIQRSLLVATRLPISVRVQDRRPVRRPGPPAPVNPGATANAPASVRVRALRCRTPPRAGLRSSATRPPSLSDHSDWADCTARCDSSRALPRWPKNASVSD